jgi:hypothetical protein
MAVFSTKKMVKRKGSEIWMQDYNRERGAFGNINEAPEKSKKSLEKEDMRERRSNFWFLY